MQEQAATWWWEYATQKVPEHDELYYLKFSLLMIAYWFAAHLVVHLLAQKYAEVYRQMDREKGTLYRTYIMSILHAIVCCVLSYAAMFWVCGEGKTVFNSDMCMDTVRYVHIWALLHTCSYFIVDFFFVYFVIKGRTPLDYQTYAHHLVATMTYY